MIVLLKIIPQKREYRMAAEKKLGLKSKITSSDQPYALHDMKSDMQIIYSYCYCFMINMDI